MVRAISLPEQRLMLAVLALLVGGLGLAEWRRSAGSVSNPAPSVQATAALPGSPVEPRELLAVRSSVEPLAGAVAGRIDLNTAGQSLLETLPGVGPAKAAAIVDDRTANGPFRSIGDLDRVAGFGEKTVARLAPYLTIGIVAPVPSPVPSATIAAPSATPTMGPMSLAGGVAVGPRGQAPRRAPATPSNAATPALLNINTATAAQLEALDGIGPVLAQRIVADRAARGPFRSVDDLDRVKGIGPAILARNRHRLAVH